MKATLNKQCPNRFHNPAWLPLRVLLCVGISLLSFTGRAQSLQVIHGLVPPVTAGLQPSASLAPTQQVNLAISLPLRNHSALLALIDQLYDPTSANYLHYLNPEQFADMFGPTTNDYSALAAFAQANNLTVAGTYANRTLLDVSGSAADVENALHVRLLVYQHPTETRTFYAPDVDPSLDVAVPVLNIDGLDNYYLPRPCLAGTPARPRRGARADEDPVWFQYMGPDFRAAYAPGVSLTGSGQTVALVEFNGYFLADIERYESAANIAYVPVNPVMLHGFPGPGPVQDQNSLAENVEVSADIELAIAMAPGLYQVLVYEEPYIWGPLDVLNQIAHDNAASQISCSWTFGLPGPSGAEAFDQIFQQFAAQGQSFFQASGDHDAYNDAFGGTNAIPCPCDSCYVTCVGGTELNTIDATGSWESETNWNWVFWSTLSRGGGGGISTRFAIPLWQQGISMTANMGSTTMRNIPDVARACPKRASFGNAITIADPLQSHH
jgi:subtilase family serine protease